METLIWKSMADMLIRIRAFLYDYAACEISEKQYISEAGLPFPDSRSVHSNPLKIHQKQIFSFTCDRFINDASKA
jgi:hypothetical protein